MWLTRTVPTRLFEKRLLRQVRSGSTQTHDDDTCPPSLADASLTHHHGRSQRTHAESVGEAAAIRQEANLDLSQSFQGQPGTAVLISTVLSIKGKVMRMRKINNRVYYPDLLTGRYDQSILENAAKQHRRKKRVVVSKTCRDLNIPEGGESFVYVRDLILSEGYTTRRCHRLTPIDAISEPDSKKYIDLTQTYIVSALSKIQGK